MKKTELKKLITECLQEVISENSSVSNKNVNVLLQVLSKKSGEDLTHLADYNADTKLIKIDLLDLDQKGLNNIISSTNAVLRLPQLKGKFKLLKNDNDWDKLIDTNPAVEDEYSNDHLVIYVK